MGRHFLALSLFIMLLAFFIVLNAYSTFDEHRMAPVMKSLLFEFSGEANRVELPSLVDVPYTGIDTQKGRTIDRLADVFDSFISGVEIKKNRLSTEMMVRMQAGRFEAAINAPAAAGEFGGEFNQMLVSILAAESQKPYRMDVIYEQSEEPAILAVDQPEQMAALVKKAANVVAIIETAGMPKTYLSTGLKKGEYGYVTITVRPYVPVNPVKASGETGGTS